jgi:Zn-finger nucleic acid-binding protein
MKCPVCTVTTTAVEVDKIELDYCTACRGIWFDKGELELLLDTLSGGTARGLISSLARKPDNNVSEKRRKCPICFRKMKKINAGSGRELLIDTCDYGHGLWFDGGEVGTLVEQLKIAKPDTDDPLYKTLFFIRDTFKVRPASPGKS